MMRSLNAPSGLAPATAGLLTLLVAALALIPSALAQEDLRDPTDGGLFSEADVADPEGMISTLLDSSDPVSAFIWDQLSEAVQQDLSTIPP
jgi:hypothetical protein